MKVISTPVRERERENERKQASVCWSERRNVGVAVDESLGRN